MPFLLTSREKDLLRFLVNKELKEFEKEEKFVRHDVIMIEGEERYDQFLKDLIKKLK